MSRYAVAIGCEQSGRNRAFSASISLHDSSFVILNPLHVLSSSREQWNYDLINEDMATDKLVALPYLQMESIK